MGLRLVIDRDADHRRSVLVAGTGRSGGTWLCDILNRPARIRWRAGRGRRTRRSAVEILSLFGLDRLYGDAPLPRPQGVLEIMGAARGTG